MGAKSGHKELQPLDFGWWQASFGTFRVGRESGSLALGFKEVLEGPLGLVDLCD